jgi:hypothetical protein
MELFQNLNPNTHNLCDVDALVVKYKGCKDVLFQQDARTKSSNHHRRKRRRRLRSTTLINSATSIWMYCLISTRAAKRPLYMTNTWSSHRRRGHFRHVDQCSDQPGHCSTNPFAESSASLKASSSTGSRSTVAFASSAFESTFATSYL